MSMISRSKVDVIIVNWNGEQFISKCLDALLLQTLPPDNILLIDNASVDNSVDIIRRYPAVKLRLHADNSGFARGNNLVVETSDSDWVALLNPDAYPDPDWLEKLLLATQKYSNYSVFGSRQLNANSHDYIDGTGDVYHVSGLAWRAGIGTKQIESDLIPREIFSPCAAAALYRRDEFLLIGGFDEDYFCYMEDVDLGFRMRLAGHQAMYVPDAVVHHAASTTTGGNRSDFSIYHGHRNMLWCFVKNMPGVLFWLFLPLHLLLNVTAVLWFLLTGHGKVILRAKRDALLGLPKMWKKRKQIQASRVASIADIWRVLDKGLVFFKR